MERIVLEIPDECGEPVSEQLRNCGVALSDSNYKDAWKSIFSVFVGSGAGECYREFAQGKYEPDDPRRWCDLCGNREVISYFCVKNSTGTPVVTNHVGYSIQWPDMMKLGSSCIHLVGIKTYASRMYNSMMWGYHPYTMTDSGKILTYEYLVKKCEHWSTPELIIPHALFTALPKQVYCSTGAEIYMVRNPVDVSKCTEKSLLRSWYASSPNAKYGREWRVTDMVVNRKGFVTPDMVDSLVTVMSRDDARKALEIYKTHTIK